MVKCSDYNMGVRLFHLKSKKIDITEFVTSNTFRLPYWNAVPNYTPSGQYFQYKAFKRASKFIFQC